MALAGVACQSISKHNSPSVLCEWSVLTGHGSLCHIINVRVTNNSQITPSTSLLPRVIILLLEGYYFVASRLLLWYPSAITLLYNFVVSGLLPCYLAL